MVLAVPDYPLKKLDSSHTSRTISVKCFVFALLNYFKNKNENMSPTKIALNRGVGGVGKEEVKVFIVKI